MPGYDEEGIFDTAVPFLAKFGYRAESAMAWQITNGLENSVEKHPQLEIRVMGHEETDGHTFYQLACSHLDVSTGRKTDWQVLRRLRDLREGLHDHIKEQLGVEAYDKYFGSTPFALKGGLPGTTGRLDKWCSAVAACTNARGCCPGTVAVILLCLEAPEPESRMSSHSARSAVVNLADKFRSAARSVSEKIEQAPRDVQQKAEKAAYSFAVSNPKTAASLASQAARSVGKW